jgi:hypothetical protein
MKRQALLRHLRKHGCYLKGEGPLGGMASRSGRLEGEGEIAAQGGSGSCRNLTPVIT